MSPVLKVAAAVLAVATGALAGCSTYPARYRAADERPPELLAVGAMDLPRDCAAEPGTVYRADFLVDASGTVARVATGGGPPCVQSALSQWVSTFRYAPGSAPVNSTVDWMVAVPRKK